MGPAAGGAFGALKPGPHRFFGARSAPSLNTPPLRNQLLTDMGRLALSAGLVHGVALLALPALQRWFYGPDAFAEFSVYSQWAGLLGAVATLRMDLALVKHERESLALGALVNGLRALLLFVVLSWLAASGMRLSGWDAGHIQGLSLWLPLGVAGMGLGTLMTAWLSRDQRFSDIARARGWGGVLGEGSRFAAAGVGTGGLIAGRIAGQWGVALLAWRKSGIRWSSILAVPRLDRSSAWKADLDYARFTAPANVLAMAANALILLVLFETAPKDWVGQVGAALAYLTVAAGLVIRSVNDVFFRHLNDVAGDALYRTYAQWAAGLLALSWAGVGLLYLIPGGWVSGALGLRWADLMPAMRWLSLWMPFWIAASALSGIFPHLGRQSTALKLDVAHLLLVAAWLWWTRSNGGDLDLSQWGILKEYAAIQGAFYLLALGVGLRLCRSAGPA